MNDQWHYAIGDQQHGPVDTATLKQLLRSGQLQATDRVWKAGMADWAAAGSRLELQSAAPAPPTPPVMPPAPLQAPIPPAPNFPALPPGMPAPPPAAAAAARPIPLLAILAVLGIIMLVSYLVVNRGGNGNGGANLASQTLVDVSGVWQANGDAAVVTLRLSDASPSVQINNKIFSVSISNWDESSKTLSLTLTEDTAMVWSVRQVFKSDTQFSLELVLHDGTRDGLSYVRDL